MKLLEGIMSGEVSSKYIFIEADKLDFVINLFRKCDTCCTDSDFKIKNFYRAKVSYYEVFRGDVVIEISVNNKIWNREYFEKFSFGEKLFNVPQFFEFLIEDLAKEGDEAGERVGKIINGESHDKVYDETLGDSYYKDYKYLMYMLSEYLPLSDKEYFFIRDMEEFDLEAYIQEIEISGKAFNDIFELEEFSIEALPPKKEFMDRINALYDLLDNEIEECAIYPEDEKQSVINIDLSIIENEIIEVAKENNLKVRLESGELIIEIINAYKIVHCLYMEGLKDLYKYLYRNHSTTKIKLARELKRLETRYFC